MHGPMSPTMEDFAWATKPNRLYLELLGLWPKEEKHEWKRWLYNFRAVASAGIMLFICCIPALHALTKICHDLIAVIDNLQFTLPLVMTTVKIIMIQYKKPVLLPLLNMMQRDWANTMDTEERNVMIHRARTARKVSMFGQAIMTTCFFLLVGLSLLGITCRQVMDEIDRDKPMIISTYYVYDITKSPQFELTYSAQIISLFVAAMSYTGIDCFLALLIFHICGQFENLRTRFLRMNELKDFNNALTANVKNHIRLIRSVHIIESTFTLMLLMVLLYFGILFCFYGFLMIIFVSEDSNVSAFRLAFLITVFVNTFGHTCLYCIAGELIVSQSEAIFYAVYEFDWHNVEPKKAKNMILIMARAKSPLCITAGKLFPMTMAMFCRLLKMSAGYISFLLTKASEV